MTFNDTDKNVLGKRFAPAADGVAVSLQSSRLPLVALLSPSIPPAPYSQ
jgi:hypothetical protein